MVTAVVVVVVAFTLNVDPPGRSARNLAETSPARKARLAVFR